MSFDYSKVSVAIDLGSHLIKGAIGYLEDDGRFICIAEETESSAGICQGYVKNISEAAGKLKILKEKLQNRLNTVFKKAGYLPDMHKLTIQKAYVSVSAAETQGIVKKIVRSLPHEEITQSLIDEMDLENRKFAQNTYPAKYGFNFFKAIPQRNIVNGIEETNPVGIICDSLEIEYQNIIIKPDLLENTTKCMERAGFKSVEFILAAQAEAEAFLTPQELYEGAILVDLGAEVLSVSVFHDGALKYLLELAKKGSDRITQDLAELRIPKECAQKIKHNCFAIARYMEPAKFSISVYGETREFETQVVSQIVENRVGKIIQSIQKMAQQVQYGRHANQIVLVGGGTNLKYFKEKIEEELGITARYGAINGKTGKKYRTLAATIGVLHCANGNSVELENLEEKMKEAEAKEAEAKKKKAKEAEGKPNGKKKHKIFSMIDSFKNAITNTVFNDPTNREEDQFEKVEEPIENKES